jgi:hypothetical protein
LNSSITPPFRALDPQGDEVTVVGISYEIDSRPQVEFMVISQAADGTLWPDRLEHVRALPDGDDTKRATHETNR